jgi:hypothetical protein
MTSYNTSFSTHPPLPSIFSYRPDGDPVGPVPGVHVGTRLVDGLKVKVGPKVPLGPKVVEGLAVKVGETVGFLVGRGSVGY